MNIQNGGEDMNPVIVAAVAAVAVGLVVGTFLFVRSEKNR